MTLVSRDIHGFIKDLKSKKLDIILSILGVVEFLVTGGIILSMGLLDVTWTRIYVWVEGWLDVIRWIVTWWSEFISLLESSVSFPTGTTYIFRGVSRESGELAEWSCPKRS